jgi:bla regulator protein BlaR1
MSSVLATLNSSAGAAIAALLNSFWLALGVVALVWLALRFLPRLNAATRYVIWWAVLGVVLVLPLAPRLAGLWRSRQQDRVTAAKPAASPKVTLLPPVTEPAVVTVEQKRVGTWPLWAFGAWAAILLFRLGQIGRSWIFLNGVKRRASIASRALPDCGVARPVRLLLSSDVASPMAVGFLKPAVILPESVVDQLEAPELDHVLLHEMAHIARLDDWTNLAARLAGAALALHPVALWILRQIEREREMACDDFVVAQTGSARPYAESLARLFEMRWAQKGEALASGIFGGGSRLGERIELLLKRGREFSPHVSMKRVASSGVVLLGFVLVGALTPRWIAFAQNRLEFEVASIKPSKTGEPGFTRFDPVGVNIRWGSPLEMVATAYQMPYSRVSSPDSGTQGLLNEKYDIVARAEHEVPRAQLLLMLRTLLEDRFKLTLHHEAKAGPVYKLVVTRNGPKLTATAEDLARCNFPSCMPFRGVEMWVFAATLTGRMGRPVLDLTGLKDSYDFTLRLNLMEGLASDDPQLKTKILSDWSTSSIFADIQQQLGLQLIADRAPVDYLVVDHLEKPDAN